MSRRGGRRGGCDARALQKTQQSVDHATSATETNAEAIQRLRNELDALGTTLRNEVTASVSPTQRSVDDVRRATEAHADGLRIIAGKLEPLTQLPEQVEQMRTQALGLDEQTRALSATLEQLTARLATLETEIVGQLAERLRKLEQS